jgi:acyl carrier protein
MTTRSLKAVIAEVLEIEPGRLDEDAGMNVTENWDSLNQFMIMSAVERDFNAKVSVNEMETVSTLKAIREFLRKQGILASD